jgi:hypothetical protein
MAWMPQPGTEPARLRALVATVAVAAALAACGSGSTATSAAPPTRAASGPIIAPPTTKAPADAPRKSEPYWVAVADLSGTGPTVTTSFEIGAAALQWRVTYHCQTSPFTAVAVKDTGDALKRPMADAASCDTEGKGFASQPGSFTLKVDTAGSWGAKVEQQVDSPLIEPETDAISTGQVLRTGAFHAVDRPGEGTAKLVRLSDGTQVIRLDNFYTAINTDLELRLSPLTDPRTTDEIVVAPFVSLAPLKATVGSMNYPVPPDLDLSGYQSIVIWCEITRNAYAAAQFPAPG